MSIAYDKKVTPEELTDIAYDIWNFVRQNKPKKREDINKLMKTCSEKWKDFMSYYAVVVRYMCELGMFCARSFLDFARRIEKSPWKNEAEHSRHIASYICDLHNAYFPYDKKGETFIEQMAREIDGEKAAFREKVAEIEKSVSAEHDKIEKSRLELLRSRLQKLPDDELAKIAEKYNK